MFVVIIVVIHISVKIILFEKTRYVFFMVLWRWSETMEHKCYSNKRRMSAI